jgi:hypothetical protein
MGSTGNLVIGAGELKTALGYEPPEGLTNNDETSAKLILTALASQKGALLTSAGGKISGNKIEIEASSTGWQASVTSDPGTVTIEADTIRGTGTGVELSASDTGDKITVEADGNLTIAEGMTINLGGTAAAVGSIVLKLNAGQDPGTLSFAGATSTVKTGNTADNVDQTLDTATFIVDDGVNVKGTNGKVLINIVGTGSVKAKANNATISSTTVTQALP